MTAPAVRLDPASIDAVARRVVELLDARHPAAGLVDAQTVADALGISRATVYDHAADLGARRLGDGPRARLRFDLVEAREAWAARSAARDSEPPAATPIRRRPTKPSPAELLPIRGRRAA